MNTKHTPIDLLTELAGALDSAFISTWQSTAAWKRQLDEAKEYLAAEKIRAAAPDLLELVELVHLSFGGGNVITFSEADIQRFAEVYAKATGSAA